MPDDFKHWTSESTEAFEYAVAADFIGQLETKMDDGNVQQKDLAATLNRTEGRISQLFNRPSNLTLKTLVRLARALGLKVTVVAYRDPREVGPVPPDIFRQCWEALGSPKDFFELQEKLAECKDFPQ